MSIGLIFVGAAVWMTPHPPLPELQAAADSQNDQRLVKLEQAVTALTQALQDRQTRDARPEPARAAVPANDEKSRQALAQMIREEVRQAVAEESPEATRAREEAIAEAELLASPENQEAYRSASDVVTRAVADKRWTEEDREMFRAAFGHLTRDQLMELTSILAPAVNDGEITVEMRGPLF
ncbi:MAG: hypothetical protein ACREV8_04540 [Gammaproteobacteria bacterium]